jgi:glycosyltransferase involved in cell wall biosynthesis
MRKAMPLVSVVMPTYNGQKYIGATIESVLGQTLQAWELLVVDDGSADRTATVVADYAGRDPRVRLVRQANGGEASARNHGLRRLAADSAYVGFLDHDDVWEPDALRTLVAALEASSDAVGAHGLARLIDAEGRRCQIGEAEAAGRERLAIVNGRPELLPLDAPTTFAVQILVNRIGTPGQALVRRAAVEVVGPFDGRCGAACDLDYWLRLTAHGDMAFTDRVVINYRQHPDQQSRHMRGVWARLPYIYRKLLDSPTLTEEQRELVRLGFRLRRDENVRLWWRMARSAVTRRAWLPAANCVRHALIEQTARSYARL